MEAHLEDVWGVKDRTAGGYATIVLCAKWIYDHYTGHFLARNLTWENFLQTFVVDVWGPVVKLAHVELTKADVICHDFGMAAVRLMSNLPLVERKRSLALAESTSMPQLVGRIPVLAIRKSDERFKELKGLLMKDVENVLTEVNGRVGNCTKFLHQGKELLGEENTEVTAENRETHRAILLPLTIVFKPTEIIYICDGK